VAPTFELHAANYRASTFFYSSNCLPILLHYYPSSNRLLHGYLYHMTLTLYVDDILLVGNNKEFVLAIKSWLGSNFEMRDMGKATYILGVKIHRDRLRKLLALSQEFYIEKNS